MSESSRWQDYQKGIVKAWGALLYLDFHALPDHLPADQLVGMDDFRREFAEYSESDDEDLAEWIAECPPKYTDGRFLFDKDRIESELAGMAEPLSADTTVYRYTDNERPGWGSYTLNMGQYNGEEHAYMLPKGFPVIMADGIADHGEVILRMTPEDLGKYRINSAEN